MPILRTLTHNENCAQPAVKRSVRTVGDITRTRKHVVAKRKDGAAKRDALPKNPTDLGSTSGDVEMRPADAPIPHIDIDAGDSVEPIFVSEYVAEIFPYLKEKELTDRINPYYMSIQKDINERMRGILFNWLAEIHIRFTLFTETFLLTCNIVDRYLAEVPVTRDKLQLVGLAATLISSKFEEIYAVEVRDLVFVADNAYTSDEILELEIKILNTIKFKLSAPSPVHFVRRWSKAAESNSLTHTLSKYLCEESVLFYPMLKYLPSTIAASAVLIARIILGKSPLWTDTMRYYIGLDLEDVLPCAKELVKNIKIQREKYRNRIGHPLVAIMHKYESDKLFGASNYDLPSERTFAELEEHLSQHN